MKLYTWKEIEAAPGVCREQTRKYRKELGGKGLTLVQAERAALAGKLSLPDLVRAAVGLKIRGRQKRMGRMIALVHPLVKPYYDNPADYQHNQQALEDGRLGDINRASAAARASAAHAAYAASPAAYAAYAAADAAYAADAAAADAADDADDAAYAAAHVAYHASAAEKDDLIRAFCGPLKRGGA